MLYVFIDDRTNPAGGGLWAAKVETEEAAAAILAKLPPGVGGEYYDEEELEIPPTLASETEIAAFLKSVQDTLVTEELEAQIETDKLMSEDDIDAAYERFLKSRNSF